MKLLPTHALPASKKLRTLMTAQSRLADDLRSEIRATKSLGEHAEAIALARRTTSDGKVLFVPR
jgi:hypothetical protein